MPPASYDPSGSDEARAHFRAHGRRKVRLAVTLRGERSDWERSGTVVDISIAGAGLETEEALTPGARVSIAFLTPTLWDPLILTAYVAWAHPVRDKDELDALGRPRRAARAGLVFDYPTPDATFAMFEMLVATAYE